MMILTLMISVVIAAWIEFGPMTGLGFTFVAMLVTAHVLGAMLGKHRDDSRLDVADSGGTVSERGENRPELGAEVQSRWASVESSTPDVASTNRPTVSIRFRVLGVFGGALIGALFGGGSLISAYSDQLNIVNTGVAILATAIVGGLIGFGLINLIHVCSLFIVTIHDENPLT